MYAPSTKQQALDILDGVVEIAEHGQLIHSEYLSYESARPALAGAICGGHQACLIGSLAIAARPINKHGTRPALELIAILRESAYAPDSEQALQRRPGLKLALEALNATAEARLLQQAGRSRLARAALHQAADGENVCESYFETYLSGRTKVQTRVEIKSLVAVAKRHVETR